MLLSSLHRRHHHHHHKVKAPAVTLYAVDSMAAADELPPKRIFLFESMKLRHPSSANRMIESHRIRPLRMTNSTAHPFSAPLDPRSIHRHSSPSIKSIASSPSIIAALVPPPPVCRTPFSARRCLHGHLACPPTLSWKDCPFRSGYFVRERECVCVREREKEKDRMKE